MKQIASSVAACSVTINYQICMVNVVLCISITYNRNSASLADLAY